MNSPAMSRFEQALQNALENLERCDPLENIKAEVLKAADQLLEDSAMEMAESTVNGVAFLLLQVYKNGKTPGRSPHPLIEELQNVLAAAGRSRDADSTAHDTY